MPAAARRRILRYLFEHSVLVVSDNQSGIHKGLECLNVYVLQIGRSFTNKNYTKKQYAWSHAYYPVSVVRPATLRPRTAPDILDRRGRGRGAFRGGPGANSGEAEDPTVTTIAAREGNAETG
jgi:hypothetical protein